MIVSDSAAKTIETLQDFYREWCKEKGLDWELPESRKAFFKDVFYGGAQ